MTDSTVTRCFLSWRGVDMGRRTIIEGIVAPEHAGPSAELESCIAAWDGTHYWDTTAEGRWLVLVHEDQPPRERWPIHVALFIITILTTSLGGAYMLGHGTGWIPTIAAVRAGLPFSIPLLAILLAHESGHYVTARRYKVNASAPYFVPFPASWNLLGTMGAFIRLRSPIFDRRTLFDIGVAGPLAGAIVAFPVLVIGLLLSHAYPDIASPLVAHQYITIDGGALFVGDSLLMWLCRSITGMHGTVHLSLVAMAGWTGLLVTSLNLLPLAQLDGGHVAFAQFGDRQRWIARALWLLLLPLGWFCWPGWFVWAALGLVLGRGRLAHPPVIAPERPLDARRRLVGWVAIALFVATFMPAPIVT